jgi:hypothetical protein
MKNVNHTVRHQFEKWRNFFLHAIFYVNDTDIFRSVASGFRSLQILQQDAKN